MRLEIQLRQLTDADLAPVGAMIYETMATAYRDRGLLEPIADADAGGELARTYLALDPGDCIVATLHGEIAGAGFLHRRDAVASIGPLVVTPAQQGQGIGNRILAHLLDSAADCALIRAHVDSFATRALGMAYNQGFEVHGSTLQLAALGGLRGRGRPLAESENDTPAMEQRDLPELTTYDATGFGGSRQRDLEHLLATGEGLLVREDGEIRGYLLGRVEDSLAFLGPGTADSPEIMALLMARLGESLEKRATIIRTCLPTAQSALVQAALGMGFRMTSTDLCLCRGDVCPDDRAQVIGLPADVV